MGMQDTEQQSGEFDEVLTPKPALKKPKLADSIANELMETPLRVVPEQTVPWVNDGKWSFGWEDV